MFEISIAKLIQSASALIVGILALVYYRRLAHEMAGKFKHVYGKALNIQSLFDSKWIRWYLEMLFIVLGVGALRWTPTVRQPEPLFKV
jgi:hypothetical protein